MSPSTQILLSLALGIGAGLFLGELAAPLAVVGDVYIRLLQMTVLPYVVVSLVGGLGRLDHREARRLGVWFLGLLLLIWLLAFAVVSAMPLAFPPLRSASFYSTTLVEPPPAVDFVGLYVPTNPFNALANSVVPAVVLFSIALGVALIGIREKSELLRSLDAIGRALLAISSFIVKLTPIGIFAIAASAAGTMSFAEFGRVQVYLVSYIALALVCTYWLLPGLVSALTPLKSSEVIGVSKDALVTAFVTGSSFVVIPMLAENSKQLLEERLGVGEEGESLVDVIVPASHNFPHAAKVLTLSFILFAGWMSGSSVPYSDYPLLFASGVAATFGSITVAIPYLLDLMHLPHDLFQLFVATGVLNARFGNLLQAMHMLAVTLLGTCAVTGRLRPRPRRIAIYAVVTTVLVAATLAGARALFSWTVDTSYAQDELLERMRPILPRAERVREVDGSVPPAPRSGATRLEQVVDGGVVRVCLRPEDSLPFSYRNRAGEWVGLDVEMANSLARSLRADLDLVVPPTETGIAGLAPYLREGACDIAMGRSALSMDALGVVAFADPYLDLHFGFVVPDHRRREFSDLARVREERGLRIAVPPSGYYEDRFRRLLPHARFTTVRGIQDYLEDGGEHFDAMIYAVEVGSAWSLRYPDYGVVVPVQGTEQVPLAYALPLGEEEWRDAVNAWIALKRADGTVDRLYDHWILGRQATPERPRWSVIRDVLGWVD